MKNKITFCLICFVYMFTIGNVYAQDNCKQSQTINLNVFSKNDYSFKSFTCDIEQGNFLKNYLVNSKKNIFFNEFSDLSANEEPKVIAVSIYTKNNKGIKKKLLISITSAYYCCTPQIEGHSYQVNIYEIDRQGENLKLKDISKKLLKDNTSGFEGKTDENVSYEYKDISSIKRWLDKNYK